MMKCACKCYIIMLILKCYMLIFKCNISWNCICTETGMLKQFHTKEGVYTCMKYLKNIYYTIMLMLLQA